MPGGRVSAIVLVAVTVGTAFSACGPGLPTTQSDGVGAGVEEWLRGTPAGRDTARALEEITGCHDVDDPSPRCAQAFDTADEFASAIADHVQDPAVLRYLRGVVLIGALRDPRGNPVVPSIGRMFPVILQLAAQGDAGDEDALVAMRRLLDGLIVLSVESRT